MEPIRILIFGDAGVGKTSIINMLTGDNERTSNSVVGVTGECRDHLCNKFGRDYIFTDTIGLNESNDGTVSAGQALKNLIKLIKRTQLGFNLVIFVIKADRILTTSRNNYELIVEKLLDKRVKVLCLVTHADSRKVMNRWWDENVEALERKNMHFDDHIVLYAGDPDIYDDDVIIDSMSELKDACSHELWEKILDTNLVPLTPVKIIQHDGDVLIVVKKVWNFVCETLRLNTLKIAINSMYDGIVKLLERLGVPNDEIKEIAEELAQ